MLGFMSMCKDVSWPKHMNTLGLYISFLRWHICVDKACVLQDWIRIPFIDVPLNGLRWSRKRRTFWVIEKALSLIRPQREQASFGFESLNRPFHPLFRLSRPIHIDRSLLPQCGLIFSHSLGTILQPESRTQAIAPLSHFQSSATLEFGLCSRKWPFPLSLFLANTLYAYIHDKFKLVLGEFQYRTDDFRRFSNCKDCWWRSKAIEEQTNFWTIQQRATSGPPTGTSSTWYHTRYRCNYRPEPGLS